MLNIIAVTLLLNCFSLISKANTSLCQYHSLSRPTSRISKFEMILTRLAPPPTPLFGGGGVMLAQVTNRCCHPLGKYS